MSNKSNNGTNNPASNKGRRGPKPIQTVAALRERLLREMMVKEVKKIEKKLTRVAKKRMRALVVADRCEKEISDLNTILADYKKETANA